MANMYRNAKAEEVALAFIHDLLIAGGLRSDNKKSSSYHTDRDLQAAAPAICHELVRRDFLDLDDNFRRLHNYVFDASFDPQVQERKKITSEAAAKAVVFFAKKLGLFWDDTVRTSFEIDAFKATILGKAVYDFGQNLAAYTAPTAPKSPAGTNRVARANGVARAAGGGQSGGSSYKSSGPQSGNVRDLKGPPGQKFQANTPISYKIIGDSSTAGGGANAFIKPLSQSRSSISGNTNKVLVGSGRGFGDCICFFDDLNDAKTFLNKLINSGNVPSTVTNLRPVMVDSDPNGYFIIGTEFGDVAARAMALNEALAESATEQDNTTEWDSVLEGLNYEEKMDFYDKLLGD